MANAINPYNQTNMTNLSNQPITNKTIANTVDLANKSVNSAKSTFKSSSNNIKEDPLVTFLKEERAKITSPEWINGDKTSPKDPYYGPKLWVSKSYPRSEYPELWEEASKFAAENGLHVAITETPLEYINNITVLAYSQDGNFLGKVVIGPSTNLNAKEGIELLKQKIFMQNTPETIATQQTSNGGLLTNAINSIRNVFRINREQDNNEEGVENAEPSIEQMFNELSEKDQQMIRNIYGSSVLANHAADTIRYLWQQRNNQ